MPRRIVLSAVLSASAVSALTALPGCASCPAKFEVSKEAQLAMTKDEGYYAEEQANGRFYVFGQKKTHEQFASVKGIQVSKSFIGAGPGGATVVVEAKDKLPEMTDRLVATFAQRHGVTLN
ncbi:MAG: hypothetical protein HMLKMBBP_03254 [Planctomycetes bacterium]|nr:hypothetical protein [Planctomycetota bacterium]